MGFELNDYILQDALTIKYGKNQKNVLDKNGEFPILGTGGLMGYANQFLYNKPSVLIGRKGSIRKVKYIDEPFWTVDTLFYSEVNEEIVYPKYMYYYLSQIDFERYNEGTTIPSLRTDTLNRISIKLPNKRNQKKILNIINPIEDKIKVNNNLIIIIEQIIQTLFKRWFLDFEFPNENAEPYKSSGGEMEESELGLIPPQFQIGKLGDIAKIVGRNFNVEILEGTIPYIGLEHMPRGSIALSEWETSEKVSGIKTFFNKNDILFGKLRPYFKKVGVAPIDGVSSTEIIAMNTISEDYYSIVLCIVSGNEFIDYTTATATGTRMPRTNWKQMSGYKIVIPSIEVSRQFDNQISPLIQQIMSLIYQTRNLKELRDTLLPKLLSGEIEIPDETEVIENVPIS